MRSVMSSHKPISGRSFTRRARVIAQAQRKPVTLIRASSQADSDRVGIIPGAVLKGAQDFAHQLASKAVAFTCASSLLLASPASSAELLRLPASSDPDVFSAQRTLVEAWTIVREAFYDVRFGGHDWEEELRSHLVAAFSESPKSAYDEINLMLKDLGDPYTRVLPAEDYDNFRVSSDGELLGVGLLIANEPVDGHLLVLAPIKGGPADRAGVEPGDEVVEINGLSTAGLNGEGAAKLLRGRDGSEVRVMLAHRTEQVPGVAGRPDPLVVPVLTREVRLKREHVSLSPVYYTALQSENGPTYGYIRLTSFSNNAADEIQKAIAELKTQGAKGFILDLRNNPGGLVSAAAQVARLWMDGHPTIFNVSGRPEDPRQQIILEDDGKASSADPLAVLVNEGSASASEILSGALQDNRRATIIGDQTYGKGKIQSVYELQDGSALFVTVAQYQTPSGRVIDGRGIRPDRTCSRPLQPPGGEAFMPGLPLGGAAVERAMQNKLKLDRCVLTAEAQLQRSPKVVAAASLAHRLPTATLSTAPALK